MKKIIGPIIFIVAIVIILYFTNLNRETASRERSNRIATTIAPLASLAQSIVGPDEEIVTILPPGASPHTFKITPQQIKKLQNIEIIFAIGHDLDNWVTTLSSSLPRAKVYIVDENIKLIHEEENVDPHYWLSMDNAATIVENMTKILVDDRRDQAGVYNLNSEKFVRELKLKHDELRERLKNIEQREIITFHDAWAYLAQDFDLKIVTTFEPFPGKEPTPQYLADFQRVVNEDDHKVLFTEPQFSNQSLKILSDDLGITVYVLDPLGEYIEAQSYIELIESNVEVIFKALSR